MNAVPPKRNQPSLASTARSALCGLSVPIPWLRLVRSHSADGPIVTFKKTDAFTTGAATSARLVLLDGLPAVLDALSTEDDRHG